MEIPADNLQERRSLKKFFIPIIARKNSHFFLLLFDSQQRNFSLKRGREGKGETKGNNRKLVTELKGKLVFSWKLNLVVGKFP